jgi:transcriptional regulator with XRE-family HTH domain
MAMSDPPPPTPEGDLIRRARELAIPKLSQPEVAHRVGINPGSFGNIERGYRHLGEGRTRKVTGDAATIAKVARVLGITPERLESDGQRQDAAELLRELLGEPPPAEETTATGTDRPSRDDSATALFPDDPVAASIWRKPLPVADREAEIGRWREIERAGLTDDVVRAIWQQDGKSEEIRAREVQQWRDLQAAPASRRAPGSGGGAALRSEYHPASRNRERSTGA